ncbi:bifunctional phosphopantothenoylcysteine decarboxylase/phosphopantothenate--cysteine ligase CoaBC [Thiospirillum jenense]|uniref:Coenzyme A biosynthesis bifunctional protein CoaBC n=1 Tax=Thiospirillum jenense TaxID=1653858 RepID=A0A839HDI4_9GAMM|nr:bifunctional phosphopantothenoylcysteine decarboxylase/phosphopantothenate--cysteine ligase CoaBC [Thiospirillum jenense]MBB1126190.1 bifunctional phosphopantothenoylcysteine decarboxylase/phosphopantothenate--cysteine ligase CoaBC [Thiospirillum jenense]
MSNNPPPPSSPRILLGISGSIAAYKTAELTRQLRQRGAEVRVVMTPAAAEFISPLTLQALSGHPVRSALFDAAAEAGMSHIELARWATQILIAPATADLIARLAHGLADDLLTTLVLATSAPVTLAPAMNHQMWAHPATVANVAQLRQRGVQFLGPAVGEQACGEMGAGRMVEPAALVEQWWPRVMRHGDDAEVLAALRGLPVLITAGPTREALDPVRCLTNHSSGKMGYALAQALTAAGAEVTLIAGPTALPRPALDQFVAVESALDMYAQVLARVAECAIFIAAAAVADYRPASPLPTKFKKHTADLTLHLTRNPDILADVAARIAPPFTVGFAAETVTTVEELADLATAKRLNKRLNMIAANRVGGDSGGFERDDNALLVLWDGGNHHLPLQSKTQLAAALTILIAERYALSTASQTSRPAPRA